jgi:hypothetical protein
MRLLLTIALCALTATPSLADEPAPVLRGGVEAVCIDASGNFVLPAGLLGTWKVNATRTSNWASPPMANDSTVRQLLTPHWGADQIQEIGGTPGHYWFKDSNQDPEHQPVHTLTLSTASLNAAEATEKIPLPFTLVVEDGTSIPVRLEQYMCFRYDPLTDTWTAQYEMKLVNDERGCIARTSDKVTASRFVPTDK